MTTVYLISRCSFDYSWRVANASGAVILHSYYGFLGGMFLSVDVDIMGVILAAVFSVLIGLVLSLQYWAWIIPEVSIHSLRMMNMYTM